MKSISLEALYLILLCKLLAHHYVRGQTNTVSSKLDFDESTESQNQNNNGNSNNTSMSGQSGGSQGTNNDAQGRSFKSSASGNGNEAGSSSNSKGPKIHGVRVTVDTDDGQKSKESKESAEITDLGKHKKRVGIHTDITFEITADGDGNDTNAGDQADKDASVPIFKGRSDNDSESRHKSIHPNYSTEHHSYGGYDGIYGGTGSRGGVSRGANEYYPHQQYYPQHSVPGAGVTGTIYRSGDGWTHYVPVWTTERLPNEQSQVYRRPSWKPCYCMSSYGTDYRHRRENKLIKEKGNLRPTSSVIKVVDGKLEQPFS